MGWNLRGLNRVWDDFTGNSAVNAQNAYNMQMWKMQQEYNSPANQMKRYREAGLNPNLIYGSGSASAGNATSAPEMQAHQSGVGKFMQLMQVARGLFDMKKEKDEIDLQKVKLASDIAHTKEAFELEKKKMLLDHIFRTDEFNWKVGTDKRNFDYRLKADKRDYDLRLAAHVLAQDRFNAEQDNVKKWGFKPGTTGDFLVHMLGATLGKTPYEVAGDTNSILNTTFQRLFYPIAHQYHGSKLKSKGWKGHRAYAYSNPSDSIGLFRLFQ